MTIELPGTIKKYVDAGNRQDAKSMLSCYSEDAVVKDEGAELRGKKEIEGWIAKTIEKYKFQFEPLAIKENDAEVVVTTKVSGTFAGSPVTLDFHYRIKNDMISSLDVR
jgi:ketosteroid isomerase-like protein